ncbi:MAG: DNA mismatch endonuclease Vsr [Sphingomonadales bacterium]|nr:DNA mismatch endonuclease Vsr [Sphingomonadales bacterium]
MKNTLDDRSRIMRAVKGKNTSAEIEIRRLVHALGYRYRLHRSDLPGKPDIVFSKRRKIIFVHGCFWHQHDCRRGARSPKSHQEYWLVKLNKNKERDKIHLKNLKRMGWRSLVIWECQIKNTEKVKEKIRKFIEK